ncbi:MAG TPA: GNAT family N-acetyltransferase [Paracoccaceae bacterium]|nr:GNAT family N-acetyltransferase [Paracoccaceae bacterium]
MATVEIAIRRSVAEDAPALAALHREAWRYAYRGIIPGLALERMIARRGPGWWRRMQGSGGATMILEFDCVPAGYATHGRSRIARRGAEGEIFELYLRPEYHGAGLGRQLFRAARDELSTAGMRGMVVRSLASNEAACRFYRAMGGREFARATERIGGARLATIAFHWR